ncbi:MAG: hypothetical protein IT337_07880 [Thermomicrobiales bacterium]|nr:hypothetical protein [Thermomicrobiales bacterium]
MRFDGSPPVIACTDRWGRVVVVREYRWDTHIVSRHPELEGQYKAVEMAIRHPDVVKHDATFATGEAFYRSLTEPQRYAGRYLKVCIAFSPGDRPDAYQTGEVITAYITSRIAKGERHKWP